MFYANLFIIMSALLKVNQLIYLFIYSLQLFCKCNTLTFNRYCYFHDSISILNHLKLGSHINLYFIMTLKYYFN